MVAIKKKINEKRISESSDSDDSEISECLNGNENKSEPVSDAEESDTDDDKDLLSEEAISN